VHDEVSSLEEAEGGEVQQLFEALYFSRVVLVLLNGFGFDGFFHLEDCDGIEIQHQ